MLPPFIYSLTDAPVRTKIVTSCTISSHWCTKGSFRKSLLSGGSFLPNDRDFGRTEMKKRKHERIYTCEQWMEVIRKAHIRKPFEVVACDTTMFLDWSAHFSPFFKKTVKDHSKRPLRIQQARVLEYCSAHPTEVWIKYVPEGEWYKFSILKHACLVPESTRQLSH